MRHYETIFIVNPNLVTENYQEVISKFSGLVEKEKGIMIKVDEWGTQKMAYDVKKFDKGAYVLFEYCGTAGLTTTLERDLKLDDRILLFQTVKLADKVDPEELLLREEEARKAKAASFDKPAETAEEEKEIEEGAAEKEKTENNEPAGEVKDGVQ